jgi:hypothetical protein
MIIRTAAVHGVTLCLHLKAEGRRFHPALPTVFAQVSGLQRLPCLLGPK